MSLGAIAISDKVTIDEDGIIGTDSLGEVTFSLDSNTGAATFAGALSAASGTFVGELSAPTGNIGGWTIGTTTLTAGNIDLNSNGTITNGNFTINNDGSVNAVGNDFYIDSSGNAYFGGILSVGIEDDLQTYVGAASDSASSAAIDATTATTKAGEAAGSATDAAIDATTATTKADEAAIDATTATTKAGEAAGSATDAAIDAGLAADSASSASGYYSNMVDIAVLKDTSYDKVTIGSSGILVKDTDGTDNAITINSNGIATKAETFTIDGNSGAASFSGDLTAATGHFGEGTYYAHVGESTYPLMIANSDGSTMLSYFKNDGDISFGDGDLF